MPVRRKPDPVEREYEMALRAAGSDEEAYELSIGLREYRELYKLYKPGSDFPNHDMTRAMVIAEGNEGGDASAQGT